MQRNIETVIVPDVSPESAPYELVERKGLGHPDTVTDGIAEQLSIDYSTLCEERYGAILHHNVDKVYIRGGLIDQDFGRATYDHPIDLFVGGRMSKRFGNEEIDVQSLQRESAARYLGRILPHLDTSNPDQFRVTTLTTDFSHNPNWYNPRSHNDLPEIDKPFSNDTAAMIGYWPLTPTEQITLALEGYFYQNNAEGLPTPRLAHIGQDIKVMSVRDKSRLDITMCIPQIATETPSVAAYEERLHHLRGELQNYIAPYAEQHKLGARLHVNTKDGHKAESRYMLAMGSCLDGGEEGMVGRGNKSRGLISSMRPNTMEAPQGKNPVYFNGKVHGYLAEELARRIADTGDCAAQVIIQANNGEPLYDPAQILVSTNKAVDQRWVNSCVEELLAEQEAITGRIIAERHFLPTTAIFKQGGL